MSKNSIVQSAAPVLDDYKLGAVVKRSVDATVYETEFCDRDGVNYPAIIKVRELDADAAMTLVHNNRRAMTLEHPHLLRLYAAGGSSTGGVTRAWVVMERADESLAAVLAERALSEDEVGEMLGPAVAALAYLHKNGYAHGALRPSNVLAVGNQIRLSCDNAVRVSEGGVPADDIRSLGALIVEAERGPSGVIRHPGRFAAIVRNCAEPNPAKRWTAEQIAAQLREPLAEPSHETKMPAATPAFGRELSKSRGIPGWIFPALGAVVLVVLLTAVLGNSSDAPPAPDTPSPAGSVASPAVAPPPPQDQTPVQPAPAKANPFTAPPVSAGRKADGWFVVVAAYGSRDAAEKRMHGLAKRWLAFHLNVSEHRSERAPWVVTLGENLSEDEAESLRASAVHAGLPHDAYIKRIE